VLAGICFEAKPIMVSAIMREPDLVSHGGPTPAARAVSYPCLCLCLGFSQTTRKTPRLRTTSHSSQMGFTLVRTFKAFLLVSLFLAGKVSGAPPRIVRVRLSFGLCL
jgi:hypothetical protein